MKYFKNKKRRKHALHWKVGNQLEYSGEAGKSKKRLKQERKKYVWVQSGKLMLRRRSLAISKRGKHGCCIEEKNIWTQQSLSHIKTCSTRKRVIRNRKMATD
jgi:hypothetical protein